MPIVAMTFESGSLGNEVARGIAERTRCKVLYHKTAEPIDGRSPPRMIPLRRFLGAATRRWERLANKTSLRIFAADETFRFLRDGAPGVIRGWGAVHLLKHIPHVIRLRICAPFELRTKRMMQRLATENRRGVEDEMRMSERAHAAIMRRHFGVDWHDPDHYDLVLSTERLSVEECVEEVAFMMGKGQFDETPESLRMIEDRGLEWAVRAALKRNPRTKNLGIAVSCEGNRIRLGGFSSARRQIAVAREVVALVDRSAEVEIGVPLWGGAVPIDAERPTRALRDIR